MKHLSLLGLMLLAGCVPKPPEPVFTCRGYALNVPDTRRLMVGSWQLVSRNGTERIAPKVLLEITATDSLRVFENGVQTAVFSWTLSGGTSGNVSFRGNWPYPQNALPHPEGYVAVCEESLRLGTCIVDGPCFFYRRLAP